MIDVSTLFLARLLKVCGGTHTGKTNKRFQGKNGKILRIFSVSAEYCWKYPASKCYALFRFTLHSFCGALMLTIIALAESLLLLCIMQSGAQTERQWLALGSKSVTALKSEPKSTPDWHTFMCLSLKSHTKPLRRQQDTFLEVPFTSQFLIKSETGFITNSQGINQLKNSDLDELFLCPAILWFLPKCLAP